MGIVEIPDIKKSFGSRTILDGVSFSVPQGEVFGFLGENGAGKTTTMKLLLGLLRADAGEIRVLDQVVTYGQNKTNQYIGYLSDVPSFYNYMKPMEYLDLCGEITGMAWKERKQRSQMLLDMVGLGNQNKKIGGFSRGMKQRLGIAQALLNEPQVLVCDEPTSALDPVGRKEILDLLSMVKEKTTVIFSTHILSDVERICDEIAILHNGKIRLNGRIAELKEENKASVIELAFSESENLDSIHALFQKNQYQIKSITEEPYRFEVPILDQQKDGAKLMQLLAVNQLVPDYFRIQEPTLEALFMEVVNQ